MFIDRIYFIKFVLFCLPILRTNQNAQAYVQPLKCPQKKKKKHRSFVVQCKISGKLHYAWINNIKWISTDRLCCFYFILRYSSLFLSSATNWLLYDTQCRTGNRARARSCLPCMCDACHFQVLFNIFTKLIYHRSVLHFDRFGDRIRFVGSHTKYLVLLNWEGVRSGNITT